MSFNFWMTATPHSTLDPSPWGLISTYRLARWFQGSDGSAGLTHWDSLQCGVKEEIVGEEMEERKEDFNSGPFSFQVVQRLQETPSGFRWNRANPRAA